MPTPDRRRRQDVLVALGLLALALLLAGWCALRIQVSSDITHFLPDESDEVTARLLRGLTTSGVGQRLVLTIGGAPQPVLADASARLSERLLALPEIAAVERGVEHEAQRQLYELYFPHRYGLFSASPASEYPALLSDAGLARAAKELARKLASPEGMLVRPLAAEDPLLVFSRVLSRLEAARQGGLTLRDGAFFSSDGTHAVLFVQSRASVLDAPAQRRVLAGIDRELERVREELAAPLTLEKSGVGRYSAHAERAMRADIERIGVLSSAILVGLLVLALRSVRSIVLVVVPTLFGAVVACAATLALFGSVHALTLAFGSTLLGVCSDYPVHLLGHHVLAAPGQRGRATALRIWPAIRLGGLTTLAGLAGLGFAGFPGIRELACFSAVGVLGALVATRWMIPVVLGPSGQAAPSARWIAEQLARGVRAIDRRPWLARGTLVAALLLCAFGAASLRFQDDLQGWVPIPDELRAEDERVGARLLAMEPGKLVVVSGETVEDALASNDRVAETLAQAVARGELEEFRSLHSLLWSADLQQQNLAALRAAPGLAERSLRAFESAGFDPTRLAPFAQGLESIAPPLSLDALLASPLAPVAGAFVLRDGGDRPPLLLTPLRGVRDDEALERAIAAIPGARYFDQRVVLGATYAGFRARTFELLAVGLAVVFGMVLVRYRSLRRALAAVSPAVLASVAALALLAMAGVRLDLFHVLGVLLVLSMGEDYGVFLVENDREADGAGDLPATALGIALAGASTVASFGLLALSEIPALRSLGQVVSIGVLLATLFAPAGLALLDRRSRGTR